MPSQKYQRTVGYIPALAGLLVYSKMALSRIVCKIQRDIAWIAIFHSPPVFSASDQIFAKMFGTETSRLDSRTLLPINILGLLVFSNNRKNGISDIKECGCGERGNFCPLPLTWGVALTTLVTLLCDHVMEGESKPQPSFRMVPIWMTFSDL